MNSDIRLLNEIYHNSITAINAITVMLTKTHEGNLYDCLFSQMVEYRKIATKAEELLKSHNRTPDEIHFIDKSGFRVAVNLAGFGKVSPHRLAKILIHGSTEGIFEIAGYVNNCADASQQSRHLAYDLIDVEEGNIEKLNNFL